MTCPVDKQNSRATCPTGKLKFNFFRALYILQCNELNWGHPAFFVAPFSKYLVPFSLMEINVSL